MRATKRCECGDKYSESCATSVSVGQSRSNATGVGTTTLIGETQKRASYDVECRIPVRLRRGVSITTIAQRAVSFFEIIDTKNQPRTRVRLSQEKNLHFILSLPLNMNQAKCLRKNRAGRFFRIR